MAKVRTERRTRTQQVHIDRRKGDDDVVEHVIRGVRCISGREMSVGRTARSRLQR